MSIYVSATELSDTSMNISLKLHIELLHVQMARCTKDEVFH